MSNYSDKINNIEKAYRRWAEQRRKDGQNREKMPSGLKKEKRVVKKTIQSLEQGQKQDKEQEMEDLSIIEDIRRKRKDYLKSLKTGDPKEIEYREKQLLQSEIYNQIRRQARTQLLGKDNVL